MRALSALITATIFFCLTACVSVKLASPDTGKRAEGVQYVAPKSPFDKEDRSDVDMAWKNRRNGNIISYLSDCQDPADPPLDQVVQGALTGLTELKYDSDETTMIMGREGKRVLASGKVDGVPTRIDLLVFKRNQCIYILGYVGVRDVFESNRGAFDAFIKGFRVP